VDVPETLLYTSEHEWVRKESPTLVRVGITDFAQESLGDVVYVSLPQVGTEVTATEQIGELESTKAVSDVYAPVSGKVMEVNSELVNNPALINQDPYGEGWICVLEVKDPNSLEGLLDAQAYRSLISV